MLGEHDRESEMADEYTPAGYWEHRYRQGRSSGSGSEGNEGAFKAAYVSAFIERYGIGSVIDWGCGDGQVLAQMHLHGASYTGVDVSQTIADRMAAKFPEHRFVGPAAVFNRQSCAELALSMDVLFHLPDDDDYNTYLSDLFGSATRYVLIYSTDHAEGRTARHVYRRNFTPDIAERFDTWKLAKAETPLYEGLASFFMYERVG